MEMSVQLGYIPMNMSPYYRAEFMNNDGGK